MENEFAILSAKVDKILEMQELILSRLSQSTIITEEPITPINKLTKKEERNQKIKEYGMIIENQVKFQAKFNLAVAPQKNRVLEYLRTNNPKVFDGLKKR